MKREKVVVAFSGGKDSTTAILKLRQDHYQVEAMTMRLGLENEDEKLERISHLAKIIDVPWRLVDVREAFRCQVIAYFLDSYKAGLTPNPCAMCNIDMKFKLLLDEAFTVAGADWFATGHYAAIERGEEGIFLTEPADRIKSQIYFLSLVGAAALAKVQFPLARLTLQEVKEIVKGLPLGNPRESQDVCFLGRSKLIDFLKEKVPGQFKPGDILDMEGNKIGAHNGAIYFTIGQRRGAGFSSDRKLYVIDKDMKKNTITLAEEKYLFSDSLRVFHPVFWRQIKVGEVLPVRVRYVSTPVDAEITKVSMDHIQARFCRPIRAVTPGQIAAFYDGDRIVAGGFIDR